MGGKSSSGIVKFFTACCLFPAFAALFLSCASASGVYRNIDNAVYQNNFERGIAEIVIGQEKKRPIYPEKNAVSLFLDKGLLEHYAGNYSSSSRDLENAERLIQEAFTKSITAGIASYIANDNLKEYPGEDYEDIYLNVFNALNYYHNHNIEEAMVEIRKITMSNGKLDLLSKKYEEGSKFATQHLLESLHSIPTENWICFPKSMRREANLPRNICLKAFIASALWPLLSCPGENRYCFPIPPLPVI